MLKILKMLEYSLNLCTKALFFGLIFICFYGSFMMDSRIPDGELTRVSRISVIVVSTYLVVEYILVKAFDGYAIGMKRTREIVISMSAATILTDTFVFIQLCVMSKAIVSIPLLLLAMFLQLLITVPYTKLSNVVYHKINPPKSLLIIHGNERSLNTVKDKLKGYQNRFRIKKIMRYDEEKLHRSIRAHSAVMLIDVPADKKIYILKYCYKRDKQVYYVPDIADLLINNAHHELIDDVSLFQNTRKSLTPEQIFGKRMFDVIISALGLVIALPIIAICAIFIKREDGGKVFYKQERTTINGKKFKVLKLRTMIENAEQNNIAMLATEDDPRITKVGKILRKTRLDELPQLLNVFFGSMSIVGPRPERESIAEEYCKDLPEFNYRLRVKAGLTGFAQIAGNYNTAPKDKLMLDLLYIENYSLRLDFKIMLQTLTVFMFPEKSEGFEVVNTTMPDDETDEAFERYLRSRTSQVYGSSEENKQADAQTTVNELIKQIDNNSNN